MPCDRDSAVQALLADDATRAAGVLVGVRREQLLLPIPLGEAAVHQHGPQQHDDDAAGVGQRVARQE